MPLDSREFEAMNSTMLSTDDTSGSGSESEPPESENEFGLREKLLDYLDSIKAACSFSSFQQETVFPNPGLRVEGCGLIPLPLVPQIAETIASVCAPAPFGKGDETVVDTSVRKTWELDSSMFMFTNPQWNGYLKSFADRTIKGLGVEDQVRFEPYKLLLY